MGRAAHASYLAHLGDTHKPGGTQFTSCNRSVRTPESRAGRCWREADQPRVKHGRLAVLHGLSIHWIADHLDKSCDRGVLRNETLIPLLFTRSNEHQLEAAAPDNAATKFGEDRIALASVGRIGLCPRRIPDIRIGGLVPKPHEIEHVDRA